MAALGDSIRIWEGIRDYAKQRIQGGKPIIQHPNVGMLIAEADVLLGTSRLLQYKFAWDCDQEKPGEPVNPLGFWYNNYWYKEVTYRLAKIGLEVYAGMGPQKELGFERWMRYNLSIQHGGGTGLLNLIKASKVL
jgi:alkylation response protein AidB-like acyl-CoA dehydrogenase